MAHRIIGFEFNVGDRWVRLQGNGGLYGDGALHALHADYDPAYLRKVEASILADARRELRRTSTVREWVEREGEALSPAERIRFLLPESIVAVRAIKGEVTT